ncbi:MAG: PqqD family protein [Micrococcaceae bacterium]
MKEKYAIAPDVAYLESDSDRVVTLKFTEQVPLAFTDTAAAIWQELEKEQTLPEIIKNLSDTYQVPETEITDHVKAFVEDLEERGYTTKVVD